MTKAQAASAQGNAVPIAVAQYLLQSSVSLLGSSLMQSVGVSNMPAGVCVTCVENVTVLAQSRLALT